jgi:hypothetical protein
MIDFQSLRASLASVSIIPPRERTKGLNGRSEGGYRRRFSLATELRCFSTSLEALSAIESSWVASSGSVAVWESWEARERMVMSALLERPLAADPGDPDVVPALGSGDKRFEVDLHAVQCGYRKGSPLRHGDMYAGGSRTTTTVPRHGI